MVPTAATLIGDAQTFAKALEQHGVAGWHIGGLAHWHFTGSPRLGSWLP